MRHRSRLWLLAAPLAAWLANARAQPTSHEQPTPGRQSDGADEVQVGAGTQGDVTTGSSGPQKKGDKNGASQGARKGAENNAIKDASKETKGANKEANQGARNAGGALSTDPSRR